MRFAILSFFVCATICHALPEPVGYPRANSTIALSRRQATCTTPNPVTIAVPTGVLVDVAAISKALFIQRVTAIAGLSPTVDAVFQGSGENVQMTISGSDTSLTIPASMTAYSLTLDFAFSSDGGASFQTPVVLCPDVALGHPIIVQTVSSEDSTDNDDNDTEVTVTLINV